MYIIEQNSDLISQFLFVLSKIVNIMNKKLVSTISIFLVIINFLIVDLCFIVTGFYFKFSSFYF